MVCLILLIGIVFLIHGQLCYKRIDKPNYLYVARYIHSVFDFWTDVLFCYTMYLKKENDLFLTSVVFTLTPLLCSIMLVIYWVYRWRTMTANVSHRITEYLGTYSVLLIVFAIFGNFESAVSLAQSKFLYHKAFSFQLKQKESERLQVGRFVNTTMLEVEFFFYN